MGVPEECGMTSRTMAHRLLAGLACLALLGGCTASSTPAPTAAAVSCGPVTVVAGTNACPRGSFASGLHGWFGL